MRRILLVFPLCVLLLLSACGEDLTPSPYTEVNTLEGVSVSVKSGTVTPSGLTAIIQNESARSCLFGAGFQVEKLVRGNWYTVEPLPDVDMIISLQTIYVTPQGEQEMDYSWSGCYGELGKGNYRIVIRMRSDTQEQPGEYQEYDVAAEFSIE